MKLWIVLVTVLSFGSSAWAFQNQSTATEQQDANADSDSDSDTDGDSDSDAGQSSAVAEGIFLAHQPPQGDATEGAIIGEFLGQRIVLRYLKGELNVFSAGRPLLPDGLIPGSPMLVTYRYSGTDVGVTEQCNEPNSCTVTAIQLEYQTGINRRNFFFGTEFSQIRGEFGEQDAVFNFQSDTLLKESKNQKNRLHLGFDIALISIPNEEEDSEAESGGDADAAGDASGDAFETFLASRKSVTMGLSVYHAFTWNMKGQERLNIGPIFRTGIHTITNFQEGSGSDTNGGAEASNGNGDDDTASATTPAVPIGTEDNVNFFIAGGVRFAHHAKTQPGVNPQINGLMELLVGYFENFLDSSELEAAGSMDTQSRRAPRVLFIGQIRVPGSLPLFAGVRANLGRGADDVRFFAALRFDLARLTSVLR